MVEQCTQPYSAARVSQRPQQRERLFTTAWTHAEPAEWVSEPGSYFAAQIGHVPAEVVRGCDRGLRCFVNVRATEGTSSSKGRGAARRSSARTHAWTYDLDGSLRKAPDVHPGSYLLQAHPTFSSQIGPIRPSAVAGNGKATYSPRAELGHSQYHFLFRRRPSTSPPESRTSRSSATCRTDSAGRSR